MSSDLVFQGDFSFVNVDATSLSTLPHRQQVTRHVHGYRRWKKGQEARRLRESSKFHEAAERSSRPQQLAPRRSSLTQNHAASPPTEVPSPTVRSLPSLIDVILLNGNSEASSAGPDRLTATINSLLGFERDCIFPAIRDLELRMTLQQNTSREVAFTSTWISESKAYLYDNIAIHSYLARIATNRYTFTSQPEFLDAALEFRRKGVESLKQYMATPQLDIIRLYRALLILLWADSSLGDKEAFQHHAAVLRDISESHHDTLFADSSFQIHHFVSVVYFEVQYAVMGFSKTSLDLSPNEWVERLLLPLWDKVSPSFALSLSDADRGLDDQLEGEIRNLYRDAQEVLTIIRMMRMSSCLNTSLSWTYAISRVIFTVGRLVNHYVELEIEDILTRAENGELPVSVMAKLGTAALILCAIYWLRELAGIEDISMADNIKLFTWNPVMLDKLGRLILAYDSAHLHSMQRPDTWGDFRIALWIFWTGFMAERSIASRCTTTKEDQNWFSVGFRELLRRGNLYTKEHSQEILDQFLRLQGMLPSSGDEWYWRCFPPT